MSPSFDTHYLNQDFRPRRMTSNGHVQTMLARRYPTDSVAVRLEQPMVIDAGPDETGADLSRPVRLLGYYNPPLRSAGQRGLVLLLHGWEGSSHSSDVQFIADGLLRAGYATFRLNARDHGPRRHLDCFALNRGLFLGTLLNEMATAARQIALLAAGSPMFIVGGSLGGSFALRLASLHAREPIPNLARVIAICPAIRPASAARAIDSQAGYRGYFRWRWLTSLSAKEQHFPDLYQFAPLRAIRRIRDMTEWLVSRYTPWKDANDYYAHYEFTPAMAAAVEVPTTIVAARNDAIIPYTDFLEYPSHPNFHVHMLPTGGHMGFVDIFPYRRWLPHAVLSMIEGEPITP